ncbi:MAG: hypothetical protein ACR2P4_08020 [Gammaproteobacteria bacterium]
MPLTGVAKKAGAAFANVGKVAVRGGRRARPKKQKPPLTPECFDKEFWDELCAGLEAHGTTGEQYLQTLAEVRDELRGKSEKRELLKASGTTKADIARAKREGRWVESPDNNARRG